MPETASPRRKVAPEELKSAEPVEIGSVDFFIGGPENQKRFFDSIEFGLRRFGDEQCNIFVTGIDSPDALKIVGVHVADFVKKLGSNGISVFPEPQDYCYVYNFREPKAPKLVILPRGKGNAFKKAMNGFLEKVKDEISGVISNDLITSEYSRILGELNAWAEKHQEQIREEAERLGFIVDFNENTGVRITTVKRLEDGKLAAFKDNTELNEYLSKLSKNEKAELDNGRVYITERVKDYVQDRMQRFNDCNRQMKRFVAGQMALFCKSVFADFKKDFIEKHGNDAFSGISLFLKRLEKHTVGFYDALLPKNGNGENGEIPIPIRDPHIQWKVNVVVDNGATKDIPVVVEHNPTYGNLIGGLDSKLMFGGFAVTDHTHIRAGSIAKANGGCLVISLNDLARYPAALPALFDSIRHKSLGIKDMGSSAGYDSHLPLRPQPIPLNLRVLVCGPGLYWRILHGMAQDHRFDFIRFFEAKAEVLPFVEANSRNISVFASWIREFSRTKGLSSMDDSAVGRLIEEGMRLAGSRSRLSTDVGALGRIMIEASESKLAFGDNVNQLSAGHIVRTLEKRFWRLSFMYEVIQRHIAEGKKIININGEKIGEINGLAVSDFGDISIGSPTRIAASVYPSAKPGMITIERESKLSGKIFDKADHTVREAIKARYAKQATLALGIGFAFEQSYSGIDGDSASLAEFFAIISAISEVPIRQSVAITGSMSLRGDVQPIGGVNEKVEGFFDVCKVMNKIDGNCGVIIPHQNADNLMLRDDVAEAVESGKFHVWPVKTIDEGAQILMGKFLGELDGRVIENLKEFARIAVFFSGDKKE